MVPVEAPSLGHLRSVSFGSRFKVQDQGFRSWSRFRIKVSRFRFKVRFKVSRFRFKVLRPCQGSSSRFQGSDSRS